MIACLSKLGKLFATIRWQNVWLINDCVSFDFDCLFRKLELVKMKK